MDARYEYEYINSYGYKCTNGYEYEHEHELIETKKEMKRNIFKQKKLNTSWYRY